MKRITALYPNKIYFIISAALLGSISAVIVLAGETNLPPLMPLVRYAILALYANLMFAYCAWSNKRWAEERPAGLVWMIPVVLGLGFMWPVYSGDLMEYLIRGRMLGLYHVSPYIALPQEFPNDLLRPYSIWIKNPDSYGPLSVYLQTIPAVLFPKSITASIWAYKMMVAGFCGLAAIYLWKINSEFVTADRRHRWAAFAYSPLLIVAALIDGHNDTIMMALTIVSTYYLFKKKYTPAFLFWTAGFLIKYMNAIQLPLMILLAIRERQKSGGKFPTRFIIGHILLNSAVVAAAFWPIWGGEGTFLAILRAAPLFYTNSFPYAIQRGLEWVGIHASSGLLKGLFWSLYACLYAARAAQIWKKGFEDITGIFRAFALVYVGFYLSMSTPFGYWYLLWALPWVILADWPLWKLTIVLYSSLGLLAFYKRINYLTVVAFAVYGGAWAFRRLRGPRETPVE